ncbi:MAG TPA: cytochrome P460 family protein [Polyangia bacterium]
MKLADVFRSSSRDGAKPDGRVLAIALAVLTGGIACGASLPDDIPGYRDRCVQLNEARIPQPARDPHKGEKNVYACNVAKEALVANVRPFPEGAVVVKESFRRGESFPWLIATARKIDGAWKWNEYTRDSEREKFRHILAGESVCTRCHKRAAESDWIFTFHDRRAGDVPAEDQRGEVPR